MPADSGASGSDSHGRETNPDAESIVVINKPRLLLLLSIELVGIGLMVWAVLEVYYFGDNPVASDTLVVVGSVLLTSATVWFSKIYDGDGVLSLYRTK